MNFESDSSCAVFDFTHQLCSYSYKTRTRTRRQQIVSLWSNLTRNLQSIYPFFFSLASVEGHLSKPLAVQRWRASWITGHFAWSTFWSRTCRSLCQSLLLLVGLRIVFYKRLMYSCSTPQLLWAFHVELWLIESNAFVKSIVAIHMSTPTLSISVQSSCMSLNDPAFGTSDGTLPNLQVEFGQALDKICCARWSTTNCTSLAECKSGFSFRHILFCR